MGDAGKTFQEITNLKYPERSWNSVYHAYVRLTGDKVTLIKMSTTDTQDIELLRKVTDQRLKYPGRSVSHVRRLFLDHKSELGKQDDKDAHLEGKEDDSVADEEEVHI